MVIDSNKIHRLLLEKILNRTNYNLVFATNEKEIHNYCCSIMSFDLVIIELFLCGTDGFALIKLIKEIRKEIPVIALTVCATKKEKEKCFQSGCDVFISKPFDLKRLLEIIDFWMM